MSWFRRSRREQTERGDDTTPPSPSPPPEVDDADEVDEIAAAGEQDQVGERGVVPTDVIVFLHVPKCGGTALHDWMAEVLAPGVLCPERHRMPLDLSRERRDALARHRVFSGHVDIVDAERLPGPQTRFTVLRDPVERLVSLYDYWRAHDPSHVERHDLVGPRIAAATTFEQFVGEPDERIVHDLDNTIVRTFTGLIRTSAPIGDPDAAVDEAIRTLASFGHVGHVGRLDDTATWLRGVLGLAPDDSFRLPRRNALGDWTEPFLRRVERTEVSGAARAAAEPLVRLDRVLVDRWRG